MKKLINTIFLMIYFGLSIYLIYLSYGFLTVKELTIIISFLVVIEILFIYLFKNDVLLFFSYPCILFVLMCLFTFTNQNNDLIKFVSNIEENTYSNSDEAIPIFKSNDNTDLIYISSDNLNIVLGLNKFSKQIVIISIPENYYIPFKNENDTISNINKYGISESIKAIENIIENKINYYIKIDSTFLAKLIDKIGGIEVESNYEFVSLGYEFKKGANSLNGKEATIFSNYKSPFIGGSRIQSENQLKILESVIKRLLSDNKFLSYLDELEEVIKTNIPSKEIIKMIKNQLIYNYNWNIINYSLDGSDSYEYTYSYKCCKLDVIKPDITTINNAITTIEYLKTDSVFN